MEKNKNILFIFSLTLISLLVVFITMYLSKNCCFWGDDAFNSIYFPGESYFSCFSFNFMWIDAHSLGFFLSKFFSYGLPILLTIHPGDFITYQCGFIRGVFVISCLLIMSKFSIIESKSKIIFVFVYLFLACFLFYNAIYSSTMIVVFLFFRYLFPLILFGIFWYYLYNNILLPTPPQNTNNVSSSNIVVQHSAASLSASSECSIKNYFINSKKAFFFLFCMILCGLILGTSNEIVFYSSICLSSLILFYNCFLNLFSLFNKNLKSYSYNLGKNFYISVISLLIGIIIRITNPGYIEIAKQRGMADINITMDILKEFSLLYWQRHFIDYGLYIYWVIFIILMCFAFYFAYKKQEIKKALFPLLMQISFLIFMFSLIMCGKTYYGHYWIENFHPNISFTYRMLLVYPILIYFDYVYKNISDKILQKNKIIRNLCNSIIIILLCMCSLIYLIKADYKLLKSDNEEVYQYKKICYIAEKMYWFYVLKDEKPILPDYSQFELYPYYMDININMEGDIDNQNVNDYVSRIYKYNKIHQYHLEDEKKAFEKFYEEGGTFSEEELKNIRFSRLFDKKFVLNEK